MRQECKDFRIVFMHDPKTAAESEKYAINYAVKLARAANVQVEVLTPDKKLTEFKSKRTRFLKDTTTIPRDKLEVLKMRSGIQINFGLPTKDLHEDDVTVAMAT